MTQPVVVSLACHAASPCDAIERIEVQLSLDPDLGLRLEYRLSGQIARLRLPEAQPPGFRDGLWQHTCFEVFLGRPAQTSYREFNFSPSGQWACYDFCAYREREEREAVAASPSIAHRISADRFELDAVVPVSLLPFFVSRNLLEVGVTAVLETVEGTLSYWALTHPRSQPDFHDRSGFVLALSSDPL